MLSHSSRIEKAVKTEEYHLKSLLSLSFGSLAVLVFQVSGLEIAAHLAIAALAIQGSFVFSSAGTYYFLGSDRSGDPSEEFLSQLVEVVMFVTFTAIVSISDVFKAFVLGIAAVSMVLRWVWKSWDTDTWTGTFGLLTLLDVILFCLIFGQFVLMLSLLGIAALFLTEGPAIVLGSFLFAWFLTFRWAVIDA